MELAIFAILIALQAAAALTLVAILWQSLRAIDDEDDYE